VNLDFDEQFEFSQHDVAAPAVGDRVQGYVEGLGLKYFSYVTLRPPKHSSLTPEESLITTYPEEWRDRYIDKSYKHYDPVLHVASRSRLPFGWGRGRFLRSFNKSQRRVFHEAREFRIVEGYSVPVFGPDGDIGVFSVVGARRQDLCDAVGAQAGRIQMLATHFHAAAMERERDRRPLKEIELTSRERECLSWTAEGKTTEDVAEIIGLTPSAVNYHLVKVVRKLQACNKLHAAVLAIRSGLI
jgi:LuxR family quorum-sensing system transcriptional regulator CciR